MAKQRTREQFDGDVLITGHLDVMDGINDTDISEIQAAAQTTDSRSVVAETHVDGILDDLSDLESDGKLTPSEKLIVAREWTNILTEKLGIIDIAADVNISSGTHYDAYIAAYDALDAYLNTDPTGVIFDLTTTTTMTGSTLRTNFANYFQEKEDLLLQVRTVTPTFTELLDGFDDDEGTTTPETPLGLTLAVVDQDISVRWLPQLKIHGYTGTLTNLSHWEVQVSDDDGSNWYALGFDGADWKTGAADGDTDWFSTMLYHTNIPLTGSPSQGKQLWYRVRTVTQAAGVRDTQSSWCTKANATTTPILAWNETIPPANGAITNLAADTYADVVITFTLGDDTHSATYDGTESSGLAGHKIWRRITAGSADVHVVVDVNSPTQTTAKDETPVSGVEYDYGISAYDENHNESVIAWYGSTTTPTYTAVPDTVGAIAAVAYPRLIIVKWSEVGGPVGPYTYTLEKSTDAVNYTPVAEYAALEYEEVLAADVEYSALADIRYRVKAKDKYANISASWATLGAAPTRDASYGAWEPATVLAAEVHLAGSGRTISVAVDAQGADTPADRTDDLIEEEGLSVQISNDGGSTWYAPAFSTDGDKGVGADTTRWYTGAENATTEVALLAFSLHNLPLTNEDSTTVPVEDETYHLRFKRRRKDDTVSTAWSAAMSVVCSATGARDIVQNAIKAMNLDPETMSQANEDLAFYYPLDALDPEDGTTVHDLSVESGGALGTAGGTGVPAIVAGIAGNAFDFDASNNQRINIGTAGLSGVTAFSCSAWVKGTFADSDNYGRVIEFHDGTYRNFGIWNGQGGDNKWGTRIYDNAGANCVEMDSDDTHTTDTWYHIVVVSDGTTATMWVNGVAQADTGDVSGLAAWTPTIGKIGAKFNNDTNWDGLIDEVRWYNRALTEAEIKFLYMIPSGAYGSFIEGIRIAQGSITANRIYTVSLAAIVANLGAITDGGSLEAVGVGANNYWCLGDGSIVGKVAGDFKVGDGSNYLEIDVTGGTFKLVMTTVYIDTLQTNVLGQLNISEAGTVETLTTPIEISTAVGGNPGFINHPTEIELRVADTSVVNVLSTGIDVVGTGIFDGYVTIGKTDATEGGELVLQGDSGDMQIDNYGGALRVYSGGLVQLLIAQAAPANSLTIGALGVGMGLAHGDVATTCHVSSTVYKDHITITNTLEDFKLTVTGDDFHIVDNDDHAHWVFKDEGRLLIDASATITVPDGTLHVHTATAGAVTADADADDLVVENSTNGGISILTPDASYSRIYFGSISDNIGAAITWGHDADIMSVGTRNAGGELVFNTADGQERVRIDADGNVGFGADPSVNLELARAGSHNEIAITSATGFTSQLSLKSNTNIWDMATQDDAYSNSLFFRVNDGAPVMVMETGGFAGFGVTDPAVAVHIYNTPATQLRVEDSADTPIISLYAGYDTHYGYYAWHKSTNDERGGYFGWGTPGTSLELTLEDGNDLYVSGGNVIIGAKTAPGGEFEVAAADDTDIIIRSSTETVGVQGWTHFLTGSGVPGATNAIAAICAQITQAHASALKGELRLYVNTGDNVEVGLKIDDSGDVDIYGDYLRLGYDILGAAYHGTDTYLAWGTAAIMQYDISNACIRMNTAHLSTEPVKRHISGNTTQNDIFDLLNPLFTSTGTYVAIHGAGHQDNGIGSNTIAFAYAYKQSATIITLYGLDITAYGNPVWSATCTDGSATVLFDDVSIAAG